MTVQRTPRVDLLSGISQEMMFLVLLQEVKKWFERLKRFAG